MRKERRALAADELDRLMNAAHAGRLRLHLSGPDRAMLCLTATFTGLRASELAGLTPASFDFAASPTTVTVEAGCSKHRHQDVVPLHPQLVARLVPWLAGRPTDALLWPGRWAVDNAACDLIRHDLKAARRQWLTEAPGSTPRAEREASGFLTYLDADGRSATSTPCGTPSSPIS